MKQVQSGGIAKLTLILLVVWLVAWARTWSWFLRLRRLAALIWFLGGWWLLIERLLHWSSSNPLGLFDNMWIWIKLVPLLLLVALINGSLRVRPTGRGTGLGMERGELESSDGIPMGIDACCVVQAVEFIAAFWLGLFLKNFKEVWLF